ncbi:MAG: ATP-binding protein [Prevotella sp.]|nr:ATP-binding protein [Prevotella sp.]MBR6494261.1 ATP-binding protein [Prevotella sp.]
MDERIILEVLAEQKEEIASLNAEKWCPRMEEEQFELDSSLAQVVIGVRRSGKSTLCHKVLLQNGIRYAYVNLDDDRLMGLETSDLNTLLSYIYQLYGQDISCFFLDEMQNVEGWHLFVNRLLRNNMRVFVTGSNAHLLSSELATHLTGRYNEIRLYPFSFLEYCTYQQLDLNGLTTKSKAALKAAFTEYLVDGGFPELMRVRNKRAYVQSLIETVITKDVKNRFRIRNVEALRQMADYLISNTCQEINYEVLAEQFGLGSQATAKKYVAYLTQAFLLTQLQKFSFKSRIRIRDSKGYVVDTGMIANRKDALLPDNYGWRLENIVFVELLRRAAPLFHDIYYYKPTSRSKEVDFVVCEQGNVRELVQVAYDIVSPKTFKRETASLTQAAEKLNCDRLILVTLSESRDETINGYTIRIRNVVDWLLKTYQ